MRNVLLVIVTLFVMMWAAPTSYDWREQYTDAQHQLARINYDTFLFALGECGVSNYDDLWNAAYWYAMRGDAIPAHKVAPWKGGVSIMYTKPSIWK